MRHNGNIVLKVTVSLLSALLLHVAVSAGAEELTVMTRNLYVGFDLFAVVSATTPEEFLIAAQNALMLAAANSFPERAEALAAEIVEKKPHLVGLQEVYNFTFNGDNGPPPFRDYLEDLLTALTAQGVSYQVAAVVDNLDVAVSLDGVNVIRLRDRDVILARADVATDVIEPVWPCRPSGDGCNYQIAAVATLPVLGDTEVKRGYAAISALVGDLSVVFVNTHLENREVGPPVVPFGALQALQAFELIQVLGALDAGGIPIVVAGDFNSDPRDLIPDPFLSPYRQLTEIAGFVDLWTLRPGKPVGFTCCQDAHLRNETSALYERVDLIFSSVQPEEVKANVVGDDSADKTTPSGLWPSDHAGVAARMTFAP